MNLTRRISLKRSLLAGAAVLAGLVLDGAINPGRVFASYHICRTDPILQLSNGKAVTVLTTITDTAADVQTVTYTVHIPAGVSVVHSQYTSGALAGKESLTVFADAAAATYATTTVVTTGHTGIPVTATTSVTTTKSAVSSSVGGLSGQALTVSIVSS
jgi:hypothetical protein